MTREFSKECRATGRSVTALMLQMAEEASSNGQVALSELQRIAQAVDGMNLIFEMSKTQCIMNSHCEGISHRRKQLLGRILAQLLESQLVACPPVLRRDLLSPMFTAIAKMVGEPLFNGLEQKVRALYFSLLSAQDHFEWSPFYENKDSISSYCQLMTLVSQAFHNYAEAKKEFIGLMKTTVPGFTQYDYFLLMCGLTQPLKLAPNVSHHRAFLEHALLFSERRHIDNFLEALDQDSKKWKPQPPMRQPQT